MSDREPRRWLLVSHGAGGERDDGDAVAAGVDLFPLPIKSNNETFVPPLLSPKEEEAEAGEEEKDVLLLGIRIGLESMDEPPLVLP